MHSCLHFVLNPLARCERWKDHKPGRDRFRQQTYRFIRMLIKRGKMTVRPPQHSSTVGTCARGASHVCEPLFLCMTTFEILVWIWEFAPCLGTCVAA